MDLSSMKVTRSAGGRERNEQPPRAWAACLTARLAAGRLGDRHAGTGPARCAGAVRRRVHMSELGVAKLPVVPAMDQSLVEPEIRRSVNGVLSTRASINSRA